MSFLFGYDRHCENWEKTHTDLHIVHVTFLDYPSLHPSQLFDTACSCRRWHRW